MKPSVATKKPIGLLNYFGNIEPTDNTNGFVPSGWFLQFGNPEADDFLKDLYDLINKFKDKEE